MDHNTVLIIALVHVTAALIVTAINIGMTQRRQSMGARKDTSRLQSALFVELTKLRELHEDNLARLARGDRFLLSSRTLTPIFKGNAVRMHLLPESEIPHIMTAYLSNEYVEAVAATLCKVCGHSSYLVIEGRTPVRELANAYARTRDEISLCLTHLERNFPSPGLPNGGSKTAASSAPPAQTSLALGTL
jgi:hypothetical protein